MHIVIDYVSGHIGAFDGKSLNFVEMNRDEKRLPQQIQELLDEYGIELGGIQSVILATKGARFSDVRAATVVANLLAAYKNIPLYEAEPENLSVEYLQTLVQTMPKQHIEPEYSAPPSISRG